MNSYYQTRNMSQKGTRKQAIPAPKLMAIENEYYRTKDALVREIKRLRGEVGTMAKRYNNAKREIEDLVKRVRSQPPPPIPKRDDEMERRIEERHERWKQHLQQEETREKEKEKEKDGDNDTVMPTVEETLSEITLSPESTPLDQDLQSEVQSIASIVQSLTSTPPASDIDKDVGMKDEPMKKRVTVQEMYVEKGWLKKLQREGQEEWEKEKKGKEKKWMECCEKLKIGKSEMGLEGDLDEVSKRLLVIVGEWNEAKRKRKFRGWGKLELLDGMLYAAKELGWNLYFKKDGVRFEE